MRQNRDCRGIFAAAAVKCYSSKLVNQVLYFAGKSHNDRGGGGGEKLYLSNAVNLV